MPRSISIKLCVKNMGPAEKMHETLAINEHFLYRCGVLLSAVKQWLTSNISFINLWSIKAIG